MIKDYLPKKWLEDTISGFALLNNVHIVLLNNEGKVLFQKPPKGVNGFSFDDVCFSVEDGEAVKVITNPYPHYEWSTIVVRGEVVGFVFAFFSSDENRLKSKVFVEFVSNILSDKIFSELQRKELLSEYKQKSEEVELIHNIVDSVSGIFNKDEICRIILDQATEFIKVERASIMLLDKDGKHLYVAAAKGLPKEAIGSKVAIGEGVSGVVFKTKKPMIVQDVVDLKPKGLASGRKIYKTRSFASIPVIIKPPHGEEVVLGVINLTDKISGEIFTSEDLRLLITLSHFAGLSIYNASLVEKLREKERLDKELEIARVIQKSLFPQERPSIEGVDIYGTCFPAYEVGGDYYDFFSTSTDTLDFIIADVSGHGVASSLIMVMLRTLVRSLSQQERSIKEVVSKINEFLYEELEKSGLFITLFYGRFDIKNARIKYVRAGHNPPILIKKEKHFFLKDGDIILGMFKDVDFKEYEVGFEKGDVLILYTDGLVDVGIGEEDHLKKIVDAVKLNMEGSTAKEIVEKIIKMCSPRLRKEYQRDDITVVGMKRL